MAAKKGNPGPPEKDQSLTYWLRKELARTDKKDKLIRAALLARKTVDDAIKGDPKARTLVFNYVEGKPVENHNVHGTISIVLKQFGNEPKQLSKRTVIEAT